MIIIIIIIIIVILSCQLYTFVARTIHIIIITKWGFGVSAVRGAQSTLI